MSTEHYYLKWMRAKFAERLEKNPRYSLRAFAKTLRIDPGTLSKILNGKKVPTPDLGDRILQHLVADPEERNSFRASMARSYAARGMRRKSQAVKLLLRTPAKPVERDLGPEVFRIVADWCHYAILQLCQTEGFRSDLKWIAAQLGITQTEANLALARMKELGFIAEREGRILRVAERLTTGDLSVTTPALRKRIRQISEKSVHSLENDPIAERNHTTMTLAIDPDCLPVAKEMIQEFMDRLAAAVSAKKKRVYELQINLFPLQTAVNRKENP